MCVVCVFSPKFWYTRDSRDVPRAYALGECVCAHVCAGDKKTRHVRVVCDMRLENVGIQKRSN